MQSLYSPLVNPSGTFAASGANFSTSNNEQHLHTSNFGGPSFQENQLVMDGGSLLSKEMKKLRLRISDYNESPVLEAVCLKMWKMMLLVQYEEVLLELVTLPSKIPLDLDCY